MVVCGDATLLEPCQGMKLRAEFFEGKIQGLKERRDENCVLDAVNQTNVCIIQVYFVWWFSFFSLFYFIFYSFNFFLRKS